jgi:transcriptional regulator with XRE-family HTH domain
MTQKHLAEAVGYSAANPISKLESGHVASIDVVLLTRIAEATKVPLAWLLGRGPETEPSEVWRVLLEHSQRQLRLLQRIADRLDRCPPRKKEA